MDSSQLIDTPKSKSVSQTVQDLHERHMGYWVRKGLPSFTGYVLGVVILVIFALAIYFGHYEYEKHEKSKSTACPNPSIGIQEYNNLNGGITGNGWMFGISDQVGLETNPNSLTYKLQQAPVYPYYRTLVNEVSGGSPGCTAELCAQNQNWSAEVQNEVRALNSFGELDYIVSEGVADSKFNAFLSSASGTNYDGTVAENALFSNSNFTYTPMSSQKMGADIASENKAYQKAYGQYFTQ